MDATSLVINGTETKNLFIQHGDQLNTTMTLSQRDIDGGMLVDVREEEKKNYRDKPVTVAKAALENDYDSEGSVSDPLIGELSRRDEIMEEVPQLTYGRPNGNVLMEAVPTFFSRPQPHFATLGEDQFSQEVEKDNRERSVREADAPTVSVGAHGLVSDGMDFAGFYDDWSEDETTDWRLIGDYDFTDSDDEFA